MTRAKTVAEAIPMVDAALQPGEGRMLRLAKLAWQLSALTPEEKASVLIRYRDGDLFAKLGELANRYDPTAGHCMRRVEGANCFTNPCAQCPDHPAAVEARKRRRLAQRNDEPRPIELLGSLARRFFTRR